MLQGRSGLLSGLGIGAGLMLLLDPQHGRRRRAMLRDRVVHAAQMSGDAAGTTGRDVSHRAYGVAAQLGRMLRRDQPGDRKLVERVRARLGRLVSHPRSIEVSAADGVVTLRGLALKSEVPRLLAAIHRVRGVQDVISELEGRRDAAQSLQGGAAPSNVLGRRRRRLWPAARLAAGAAGAAGLALLVRAGTNLDTRRLTGIGARRRAVEIRKTIVIDAPIEDVFAFWSDYTNFPRFLSRVLDVRRSSREGQSHWIVAGPGGTTVQFDVEVSAFVENHSLGWRSVEGSMVGHAGRVQFEPLPDRRTRVSLRMSYNPPSGWVGHGVAAAFGVDPRTSLDEDLVRMKTLLETGRAARDAAKQDA